MLPAVLLHFLHFPELQAVGDALGDAGGLQPLVDPVHAIIALHHPAGLRVPLGGAPGAGGDAALAAHAQGLVHVNDAVPGALAHGAGGAGGHAPGLFAVEAGHEHEGLTGDIPHHLGAHRDDLAEAGPDAQPFVGFAVHLAAQAADALALVLQDVINAHQSSSYWPDVMYSLSAIFITSAAPLQKSHPGPGCPRPGRRCSPGARRRWRPSGNSGSGRARFSRSRAA